MALFCVRYHFFLIHLIYRFSKNGTWMFISIVIAIFIVVSHFHSYIQVQNQSRNQILYWIQLKIMYIINLTTLIISEKPWNTGTFADMNTEFTTDLLLLRKEPWYAQHRESQPPGRGSTQITPYNDNFIYRPWRRFFTPKLGEKGRRFFMPFVTQ